MKDIILVVVILISVALMILVVRFNEKATKANKSLEEERYSRMVAEESLQKNASKISYYENQLKSANENIAKIKDILEQEKDVNKDLKNQYEKLTQTKAELEEKLSGALQAAAASAAASSAAVAPQEPALAAAGSSAPAVAVTP